MSDIFCCASIQPYRPKQLDHESKFSTFMKWSNSSAVAASITPPSKPTTTLLDSSAYVVQVVRQKNFGALEWKRYFAVVTNPGMGADFMELTEKDITDANFEKLNSYKNFKCVNHNLFFETNLYQKNPVNLHHWRANVARPASDIDLPAKSDREGAGVSTAPSAVAPQVAVVKQEVDAIGATTTFSQAAVLQKHLNEYDGDDIDDDYLDRRDESSSPYSSGGGDDFAACSKDDCGYCGKCMY